MMIVPYPNHITTFLGQETSLFRSFLLTLSSSHLAYDAKN